jgi:hypothetical protein
MAWGFRSKRADKEAADKDQFPNVAGVNGYGFGALQVIYDKRPMPDPGAQAIAYLTELLPVEQLVGPAIENAGQRQTNRHPGEMVVSLQGVGLTVIGAPGVPAGYFALQPLTDISSAPGGIPIIANAPIGQYEIPA